MENCFIIIVFLFFSLPDKTTGVEYKCAEKRLEDTLENILYRDFLSCNENKAPFNVEVGKVTEIDFQLVEIKLLDSDSTSNSKLFSFAFHATWTNPHMAWDETTYPTKAIYFGVLNLLWFPSMFIAGSEFDYTNWDTQTRVQSNGTVNVYFETTASLKCDFGYANFPSQRHYCYVSFAILRDTYSPIKYTHKNQVNVTSTLKAWTGTFYGMESYRRKDSLTFTGEFEVWEVRVLMKSKGLLLHYLLTIPTIIIEIFLLISFHIPTKNNQRLAFSILLLLCVMLMLFSVERSIPNYIWYPPLIIRYMVLMLYMFVVAFSSSIVTTLFRRQTRSAPPFLRKRFLKPCFLSCLRIKHTETEQDYEHLDGKEMMMMMMLDQWVTHKAISEGRTDRVTSGSMKMVALVIERLTMVCVSVLLIFDTFLTIDIFMLGS